MCNNKSVQIQNQKKESGKSWIQIHVRKGFDTGPVTGRWTRQKVGLWLDQLKTSDFGFINFFYRDCKFEWDFTRELSNISFQ